MHYDFIEIGTADFDTEIERCNTYERGISVEPVLTYLNKLPNKPHVHKVLAAISNTERVAKCLYVPEEKIKELNLPWWVRGCNTIDTYHSQVVDVLRDKGLIPEDVIVSRNVPVHSIRTLLSMYEVTSINFLKIDTEGHDWVILASYLSMIKDGVAPKAKRIAFESNALTKKEHVDAVITAFVSLGYVLRHRGEDTVLTLD